MPLVVLYQEYLPTFGFNIYDRHNWSHGACHNFVVLILRIICKQLALIFMIHIIKLFVHAFLKFSYHIKNILSACGFYIYGPHNIRIIVHVIK